MTEKEFAYQLGRIGDQFGAKSFGTERAKLLWREVSAFEGRWLEKAVDLIIANSRGAPVLSDFASFISEERERRWKIEKEQNTRDAEGFWKATATDEDRQVMLQTIRERVKGMVNDQDWKCFLDLVNTRFGGLST